MKVKPLFLLLLLISSWLLAETIDPGIDNAMDAGSFYEHNNQKYFISNTFEDDTPPSEIFAHEFVTRAAMLFLIVKKDWKDYSDSDDTIEMHLTQYISCPYTDGEKDCMLTMSMFTIENATKQYNKHSFVDSELYDFVSGKVTDHAWKEDLATYK